MLFDAELGQNPTGTQSHCQHPMTGYISSLLLLAGHARVVPISEVIAWSYQPNSDSTSTIPAVSTATVERARSRLCRTRSGGSTILNSMPRSLVHRSRNRSIPSPLLPKDSDRTDLLYQVEC